MGCTVSRSELRGRGAEAALRSFKRKIHDDDDVSTKDPARLTHHHSSSDKLLLKQSVSVNGVFVLRGVNQLLQQDPSYHHPQKLDSGALEEKQIKATNHGEELEDGGGAVIPNYDGPLWMASPSFREYCVAHQDSDLPAVSKGNNEPENTSNREILAPQYSNNMEIANNDNHIQHDYSSSRSVKIRSNLKKVLTMHPTAALRNLFSVATSHNPRLPPPPPPHPNGPPKSHGKSA